MDEDIEETPEREEVQVKVEVNFTNAVSISLRPKRVAGRGYVNLES